MTKTEILLIVFLNDHIGGGCAQTFTLQAAPPFFVLLFDHLFFVGATSLFDRSCHCEERSDEAISQLAEANDIVGDCFAREERSLAMTQHQFA